MLVPPSASFSTTISCWHNEVLGEKRVRKRNKMIEERRADDIVDNG